MVFPNAFGSHNATSKKSEEEVLSGNSSNYKNKSYSWKSRRKRKARSKENSSDGNSVKREKPRAASGRKIMKPNLVSSSESKGSHKLSQELRSLEVNGVTVTQPNDRKIEISFSKDQNASKEYHKYMFDEIVLSLANNHEKWDVGEKEREKVSRKPNPTHRRHMSFGTLKQFFCYISVPLTIILLILAVLFGLAFSYAFNGFLKTPMSSPVTSGPSKINRLKTPMSFAGQPLAPINGILHVIKEPSKLVCFLAV